MNLQFPPLSPPPFSLEDHYPSLKDDANNSQERSSLEDRNPFDSAPPFLDSRSSLLGSGSSLHLIDPGSSSRLFDPFDFLYQGIPSTPPWVPSPESSPSEAHSPSDDTNVNNSQARSTLDSGSSLHLLNPFDFLFQEAPSIPSTPPLVPNPLSPSSRTSSPHLSRNTQEFLAEPTSASTSSTTDRTPQTKKRTPRPRKKQRTLRSAADEEKRLRRKEKNRRSAQASRDRKKEEFNSLTRELIQQKVENEISRRLLARYSASVVDIQQTISPDAQPNPSQEGSLAYLSTLPELLLEMGRVHQASLEKIQRLEEKNKRYRKLSKTRILESRRK